MKRMENPRIVPIVWYREAWEEQEEIFRSDPWEYGLTDRNKHNLETLVGYSFEQGLIKRKHPPRRAVSSRVTGPQTRRGIHVLARGPFR